MVQISESATNGNRRESVTVRGLLATVHRQRFKASPVRTRRSVVVDLETESGLIGDGEWRRFNGFVATANGDGEWRRFNGFVSTVNGFDGDASRTTLRRRRFDGELRRQR